ncbi:hypothetical protein [Streptomyces sp. NPDC059209]|uniref:hypothetical protein n=1 Tax=Streptomyces sp. NPDC059209 TaxID=3346769 RepID=UPI0036936EA6
MKHRSEPVIREAEALREPFQERPPRGVGLRFGRRPEQAVRRIPVTGGKVTPTLDGAPRIYHGLVPRTDGQGHHTLSRAARSRRPGEPRTDGHR